MILLGASLSKSMPASLRLSFMHCESKNKSTSGAAQITVCGEYIICVYV